MKYKLWIWLTVCLFSLFTACQDDINMDLESGMQMAVFEAFKTSSNGISTRATDQRFEPGDEIGIYVVQRNGSAPGSLKAEGNFADNKHYIVDTEGNLRPYGEEDRIFISKYGSYDFYAYYPYDPEMTDPTDFVVEVETDQSDKNNYARSDVMFARNLSGVNGGTIYLAFERKLALVEIHFENIAGRTLTSAAIPRISQSLHLNLFTNQGVTEPGHSGRVQMNLYEKNENYYVYRALLPAQRLMDNHTFDFTINGELVRYITTTVTPLAPGEKSIYLLNMQYRIRAVELAEISGEVTGAEKEIFNHGESVHLKAIPADNYYFEGWYESPMGGWQDSLKKIAYTPDYSFIAKKSMCYIAVFEPIEQLITVNSVTLGSDSKGGAAFGGGYGRQGQLYGVRAVVGEGFTFAGWYENNVLVSEELTYTFIVPKHPVTLEARFQKKSVTVYIDCYPSIETLAPYYPSISSPKTYNYGQNVRLTGWLSNDSPYTFDGWYENGVYINRDFAYVFTATEDRHLIAKYGLRIFGLVASSSVTADQPGYFKGSLMDGDKHPTFLKKGQKVRITGSSELQIFTHEYSTPVKITKNKLTIKIGERVILETSEFTDFIFTAPEDATYTFDYSMSIEGFLLAGEKAGITLMMRRLAWLVE